MNKDIFLFQLNGNFPGAKEDKSEMLTERINELVNQVFNIYAVNVGNSYTGNIYVKLTGQSCNHVFYIDHLI